MFFDNDTIATTWTKTKSIAVTNNSIELPRSKKRENKLLELIDDPQISLMNLNLAESGEITTTLNQKFKKIEVPAISSSKTLSDGMWATVIQIWEGTVLSIDPTSSAMSVKLTDRGGLIAEHHAEVDLQWVIEQDIDLVVPGAIFYWTIYKETKRGSIKNSQEIRFRRLPNWSKSQLIKMRAEAENLESRFSTENRIAD